MLGLTQPTSGDVALLGLPHPAKRIEARIPASLERVALAQRADDRVKTFSLDIRQRLGIARCLLAHPALLILDEPMNGLDRAGILEMRRLIGAFVTEGRTVFPRTCWTRSRRPAGQVAIVDEARVNVQGAVGEIAARGEPTVLVEVETPPPGGCASSASRTRSAASTTRSKSGLSMRDVQVDGAVVHEPQQRVAIVDDHVAHERASTRLGRLRCRRDPARRIRGLSFSHRKTSAGRLQCYLIVNDRSRRRSSRSTRAHPTS